MAALSLIIQGAVRNDPLLSLLDYSWTYRPILKSCVPTLKITGAEEAESETALRSSEENFASGIAERAEFSTYDHQGSGRGKKGSQSFRCSVHESEMRRIFDRFDENEDGLICGEDLRPYMKCCCGKDMSAAEIESVISSVDSNNDGCVNFQEFLSLYQTRFSNDDEEEEFDGEDEDALLEAFRIFDKNQDGFISVEELQCVLLNLGMPEGNSLTSCEEMIRNVDRNGDRHCDFLEFQEMMSLQHF